MVYVAADDAAGDISNPSYTVTGDCFAGRPFRLRFHLRIIVAEAFNGSDDDNFFGNHVGAGPSCFIPCVPTIITFDYRLREGSPAIGAADPALTLREAAVDFFGNERGAEPDLGAYVYVNSSLILL